MKTKLILMLIFGGLMLSSLSYGQVNYMFLNGHTLGCSAITSTSVAVQSGVSNPLYANSAYDASGNLLFTTNDSAIYDASGSKVYAFRSGSSGCFPRATNSEEVIFPIPSACNNYYVLFEADAGSCGSGNALVAVWVDASSGTPTIVSQTNVFTTGSSGGTVSASKLHTDGSRNIFYFTNDSLYELSVNSSGTFSSVTTLGVAPTAIVSGQNAFSVLSGDENHLGFSEGGFHLYDYIFTNGSYSIHTIQPPAGRSAHIKGIEYCPTDSSWYISYTSNSGSGLAYVAADIGSSFTTISSTSSYNSTTLAWTNGHMIFTSSSGDIAYMDITSGTPAPTINTTSIANANYMDGSGTYFGLNKQIEGDDYTNYLTADFTINSATGTCDTPLNVCESYITLNNLSNYAFDANFKYKIQIYDYDTSGCSTVSQVYNNGSALNTGATWTSGYPTNVNLTSLSGTGNNWYTTTGDYKVVLIVKNGCSDSSSSSEVINVIAPPTVTVSASASPICYGSSATLTASGASSYTWSPSTGLSATTGLSVTATLSATTTYIVTGTASDGCSNTAKDTIVVIPNLIVSAGSNTKICSTSIDGIKIGGNPTASGCGFPFYYSWTSNPSGFTSSAANPTVAPTVTTTYFVTVTDSLGGDTITDSVVIIPDNITNTFTFKDTVCVGTNDTLTAGLSGASYTWIVPCGLTATEINGDQSLVITADSAGMYIVCLTVTDSVCTSVPYCGQIYFDSCSMGGHFELLKKSVNNTLPIITSIEVYPTIINNQTALNVTIPTNNTGILDIYNLLGEKMQESVLPQGSNLLWLSSNNFAQGVYMYRVILNDNTIKIGKLIWAR